MIPRLTRSRGGPSKHFKRIGRFIGIAGILSGATSVPLLRKVPGFRIRKYCNPVLLVVEVRERKVDTTLGLETEVSCEVSEMYGGFLDIVFEVLRFYSKPKGGVETSQAPGVPEWLIFHARHVKRSCCISRGKELRHNVGVDAIV